MKKVNLEAQVLETAAPLKVYIQYGNSGTVTNAVVGDETGKIKLCLWNEQGTLANKGDTVQIKNATVSTYKGERQLRLGKNGTINAVKRMPPTKTAPEKSFMPKGVLSILN
jgi:replication factor A1